MPNIAIVGAIRGYLRRGPISLMRSIISATHHWRDPCGRKRWSALNAGISPSLATAPVAIHRIEFPVPDQSLRSRNRHAMLSQSERAQAESSARNRAGADHARIEQPQQAQHRRAEQRL